MMRGAEMSDKTLAEAVEVIRKVGPLGSHYLAQEHYEESGDRTLDSQSLQPTKVGIEAAPEA
jgi:hypothetical protein